MNNFDYEKLLPYIWYLVLAMWGGLARYLIDLQRDSSLKFSFFKLCANVIISGFAGVITLNLVDHFNISSSLGAAMIAVSGHAGVRAVEKLEALLLKLLEVKIK